MTPEREQKIIQVASRRQPDLTLIFENIHDPHNISAVLRTADAVGVYEIFIINSITVKKVKLGKKSSSSAKKWLTIHEYKDVKSCFEAVRQRYNHIYSTLLTSHAVSLYSLDLTEPCALVFGNEHAGVSVEAAALSDGNFIIPQMGMVQSLNISVACAITLYEAFRQRHAKGYYDTPRIHAPQLKNLIARWKEESIDGAEGIGSVEE